MSKKGLVVMVGLLILGLGIAGLGSASELLNRSGIVHREGQMESPLAFTPTGDTIYYDDGSISWLYAHQGSKWYYAVRMTPVVACTLKGMAWFWYDAGHPGAQTCSLYVWDVVGGEPGTVIAGPEPFLGVSWTWAQADLSPPYPVFAGNQDFFLGAAMMGPPYGVFDAATTTSRSWFSTDGAAWINETAADLLCRALVEYENVDIHDMAVTVVYNSQGYLLPNPGDAQIEAEVRNEGNVPETGIDIECTVRDTAYSLSLVYSDTQTVASLDPDSSAWPTFIPNWQPDTDGEYIISIRALLSGDMNPDNDQLLQEAQVCTYPSELTYDDNEADGALPWAPNSGHAMRFVPPSYPCQVTELKVSTQAGLVRYQLLDDAGIGGPPGVTLVDTTMTGVDGWNAVDLSAYNIMVNDGCFYVAYIYVDGDTGLYFDSDAPGTDQRWSYDAGAWTQDLLGNDWLIRATVATTAVHDGGVVSIDAPPDTVFTGFPYAPIATVRNFGAFTETFDVTCTVDVYVDTVSVANVAAGRAVPCTFSVWTVPWTDSTTYSIGVRTWVNNDNDPSNDTLSKFIFGYNPHDVGVEAIISPLDTVYPDSTYPVEVMVCNYGEVTEDSVRLTCIIGGVYQESDWIYGLDSCITVPLAQWTASPPSPWTMCAFTQLDHDRNIANDTLCKTIYPFVGIEEARDVRGSMTKAGLRQNHPNPFTRTTAIPYSLPPGGGGTETRSPEPYGSGRRAGDLSTYQLINLSVYDLGGRLVRTLVDEAQEPGYYIMLWDGRADDGTEVPSGMYFYRLQAADFRSTKKMILLK